MSENIELLNKTEYETIGQMLFELIQKCPYIPNDVRVRYQGIDTDVSIGVFTLPGAKYVSRNVIGGFTAQVKFQVAYKSFPISDDQRIESQALVDKIMDWLEDYRKLPALSKSRTITKITASDSLPYKDKTGDDKSIIFAADAVMEYEA